MPVQKCEVDGKPGWRWGESGKCYTYIAGSKSSSRQAKRKAIRQGLAIGGGKLVERITEYADSRGLAIRADNGILRNVKILGMHSQNGREYKREAMEKAVSLYEGARVNVDHAKPSEQRSYADRIGQLSGVHLREDGLYGDLKFNPEHRLAKQLLWDAQNSPASVGLSHNIEARASHKDGKAIVEEIKRVLSVDLVADPATTRSLFEGIEETPATEAEMTRAKINDLPDSDFAYIEPGGTKDEQGRTVPRSKRHFPIHDAAHVRNALARLPQSNLSAEAKRKALAKIKAAAKRLKIEVSTEGVKPMDELTVETLRTEYPDLIKEIVQESQQTEELTKLKEENVKLTAELATYKEAETRAKRTAWILEQARNAGVELTEALLETCERLEDQYVTKLIEELQKPATITTPSVSSKPKAREQQLTEGSNWSRMSTREFASAITR